MSEQELTTTTNQETRPSACPHAEAVGTRWGDPISEERQAELRNYLGRWDAESDRRERGGPFHDVALTGADVGWLAKQSGRDVFRRVSNLHLEAANLSGAHLEGADLSGAHLNGANLRRAYMVESNLEQAALSGAHLEGAHLYNTQMKRTILVAAHLDEADLMAAHLQGAHLTKAHLEGANLRGAHLEGADLVRTWLDSKTVFQLTTLDDSTKVGDIQWGGVGAVDLTAVGWHKVRKLGDERGLRLRDSAETYEEVVRAYRQLATQLRAQGMTEVADRFSYRAQVLQRGVLIRRFRIPQYLGSLLLDLISGYGYKPMRSLIAYVVIVCVFAGAYLLNAQFAAPHLTWDEALVLSISAFHGRGFFTSGISLGDMLARLAAGEAIIGLLIEITFIATFTQRFFAR